MNDINLSLTTNNKNKKEVDKELKYLNEKKNKMINEFKSNLLDNFKPKPNETDMDDKLLNIIFDLLATPTSGGKKKLVSRKKKIKKRNKSTKKNKRL